MTSRALAAALALGLALASGCACSTRGQAGTLCTRASDCTSGLVCGFGTCRVGCARDTDCSFGAACLIDGSGQGACGAPEDMGCASAGHVCSTGLACLDDRCERTCTSAADCPPDRVCSAASSSGGSFCVSPTGTDAGVSEAGTSDGGGDASTDAARDAGRASRITVQDGCIGTGVACVIGSDHGVYCWGSAAHGALGDGAACDATGITHQATHVAGITGADVVACGDGFVCAHASDGRTRCWGRNDLGQLGRGTVSTCESAPAPVVDGTGAPTSISSADVLAAGAHACTLALVTGDIRCWGRNDGVLDVRASADPNEVVSHAADALQPLRDAPMMPLAGGTVTTLSVSAHGAAARIIVNRDLYLWGDNDHLETSSTAGPQYTAVFRTFAGRGTSTSAGRLHRCALDSGGAICWGDDGLGQLGHPPGVSAVACGSSMCEPPGPAMGAFTAIATSGDGDATCGVIAGGSAVRCWGDNAHALSGVAASTSAIAYLDASSPAVPFPAAARTPFSRAIVGPEAACAIDAIGVLWCWGDHDHDAGTADLAVPVAVALPGT